MYDIKAGASLPITGIGKGALVTSWRKKKSFLSGVFALQKCEDEGQHENTSFCQQPHHQRLMFYSNSLIDCVSQAWGPYVVLEVALVRGALPPPSLCRVNQKMMGRATPPPCQGSGNYSHLNLHPEKAWHLLFNSCITKKLQLLKMAAYIHRFILPHSSVLKSAHSFPPFFCTFHSTTSCKPFCHFWGIFFCVFFSFIYINTAEIFGYIIVMKHQFWV